MYGAQTCWKKGVWKMAFENDVEMYGAQTIGGSAMLHWSLRMM